MPPLSPFSAFRLLLSLRLRLAFRALTGSSSTLIGFGIVLFIFGPAILQAAKQCREGFANAGADSLSGLAFVLFVVQALWLMVLLAGRSGIALLNRDLPMGPLRTLPFRPASLVASGMIAALMDAPTLLTLPVLVSVVRHFGGWSVLFLLLFTLQVVVLAQILEQAGTLLARRWRGNVWAFFLTVLLLGSYAGLRPALAATKPKEESSIGMRGRKKTPKVVLPAAPAGAVLSPSSLPAQAIHAAHTGKPLIAVFALLGQAGLLTGTFVLASRLTAWTLTQTESVTTARRHIETVRPDRLPPLLQTILTVAVTDAKRLVREPASHLPLRSPAMLIFSLFFGWIAPNMGNIDYYRNMGDLVGMGAILYAFLWQVQLLCDRFGNESRTASLLFGLPVSRRRLLIGRNVALGLPLLVLDSGLLALLCSLAHAPQWILPALGWLAAGLVVVTTLGNVVSALLPFPIGAKSFRFTGEQDRSIAFLYALLGVATYLLLQPALWIGPLLAVPYLAGLYAASVWLAGRLTERHEAKLIHALDGRT